MPEGFDNFLLLVTIFVVVTLAAFWLAIVIWAYRDMRSRSRDPLAHWLVAIIVFLLSVPGLFIYILLRPARDACRVLRALVGRGSSATRDRRKADLPRVQPARAA